MNKCILNAQIFLVETCGRYECNELLDIYTYIYYIVIYTANKPFWRPVYKCRMQLCDLCWHVSSVVNRATSFFLTHSLVLNAYSPAMLVPDIVHHRWSMCCGNQQTILQHLTYNYQLRCCIVIDCPTACNMLVRAVFLEAMPF